MKAVRLLRANTLNDRVSGDANAIRILSDEEAYELVSVHRIAVYEPRFDPPEPAPSVDSRLWNSPEPEPAFAGPDHAARRLEELKKLVSESDVPPLDPGQGLPGSVWQAGNEPSGSSPDYAPAGENLDGFGEDPAAAPELPRPADSKAMWVDWAVSQGCPAAAAAMLTKNQLMARYGERL